MSRYDVDPRAGQHLLREAVTLARAGCQNTADLLARLAVIDEHRLYLPAGYASMHAWCMGELPFSEDGAERRINASRVARRFPALFDAVAEGRLHLSAVLRMAPHLTRENCAELIAAASGKSRREHEEWLADRFPATPLFVATADCGNPPAPARVDLHIGSTDSAAVGPAVEPIPPAPEVARSPAPGQVEVPVYARITPLGGERYRLDGVIDRELHELLREAQELLGHAVPSGALAEVLRHCVRRTVTEAHRRKHGAAAAPRAPRAASGDARRIPAHVRRAVTVRDGGQCTFVGDSGHRCECRRGLEFDHVVPVAKGGKCTEDNLRLRCRAHNQFTAEREFGAALMRGRREQAKRRAAEARVAKEREQARARERLAAERRQHEELAPWLRALGFAPADVRRAAAACVTLADQSLEGRIKHAAGMLAPRAGRWRPEGEAEGDRGGWSVGV